MSNQVIIGKLMTFIPLFSLVGWLFWQAFKDPRHRRLAAKVMLLTLLFFVCVIGGCILQLDLTAADWQRMRGL